jgi:putative drug exporter of the RND superfamily
MTSALYGLGRLCVRHRLVVVAAWVLAVIALVVVSRQLGETTNNELSLPGTGSQRAADLLETSFPGQAAGSSPIVIHAKHGKLAEPRYEQAIERAVAKMRTAPKVASASSPFASHGTALNKSGTIGYISLTTSVSPGSLSTEEAQAIIDAAHPAVAAGLEVQTGGQLGQKVSQPSTESSELIGIIAAMVILTVTFGTVVAMLLPILNAVLALLATLAIVRLLGHLTNVPSVGPTLATMIGLGVGIDYALFIITRHLRGLRDGLALDEAIARAVATSGGAVAFAGGTVTIALVSLAVAGIPLVTTMGLMAAIAVLVAVLAALTLLPAALGIVGGHIHSLPLRRSRSAESSKTGMWARWAGEIARRPILAAIAALAILIPLAIPMLSLTLGQQDTAALSKSTTARRAYDLIAEGFGPGVNGPLLIAAALGTPAKPAPTASRSTGAATVSDPRLQTLQREVAKTSGVASVTPVVLSRSGTTAYFDAVPGAGPSAEATANLVQRLRSNVIPAAERGVDMHAEVGGSTAGYVDLASRISSKLPLQIVVVILLSFLLLMLCFRTAVVPPQAAIMNLLSIGASYGVLTAIFQFGWASELVGLSGPVPIVSYVPLFMFAILFGLSMDYEVFLVSQIEEHVQEGQGNREAVVSGLVTSARVITAAASIMVFVFGSFLLNGDPTVKQFGVGLAIAVVVDATVVRCLLVPALMILVGKANWWLPRWLDRMLPRISIEGAELFARRDAVPGPQAADISGTDMAVP